MAGTYGSRQRDFALKDGDPDVCREMFQRGHADQGVAVPVEFRAPDGDGQATGDIAATPPPTPLLPGNPARKAKSPDSS